MENFLRKIKLIRDFSLTVPLTRNDFINHLSKKTIPTMSLLDEISSKSDQLFVGHVTITDLAIRPKRKLGQRNHIHSTKLVAKLNSTTNSVSIEGEVGLTKQVPLMVMGSAVVYFVVASVFLFRGSNSMIIPLIIQLLFMLAVFYFVFRHTVKSARDFFERELYFLANGK